MKIIFAWELGKNYGHVASMLQLAQALAGKADISFILQRPGVLKSFKVGFDYRLFQAPFSPVRPLPDPVLTYSDDLRPCGYLHPDILAGLIESWQSLYDLIKPDILVTQTAVTAQLAALSYKFKKVDIGSGYSLPPLTTPLPALRYWEEEDSDALLLREQQVVKNINAALKILGQGDVETMAEIFRGAHRMLTTFEELDHYKNREEESYYGPLFARDEGASLKWNKEAEKKIFAYLRPGTKAFAPALEALTSLPERYDVIIAAPGISPSLKEQKESGHIGIEDGPVRLDRIVENCDLAVCHAGVGVSSAFLLGGVPLLMLPGHIEQLMLARAVGRTGAGRGVIGDFGPEKVRDLIALILDDEEFRTAARAFAWKYRDYKPNETAQKMAVDILTLRKKGR